VHADLSPSLALTQGMQSELGSLYGHIQAGAQGQAMAACGPFTHVFSHVIHEVAVHRWDVPLPTPLPIPGTGTEGASGSAPVSTPGSEVRWCTIGEVEGLGLTTWTVKALHVALQQEYQAWKSAAAGGAGSAGSGSNPATASAWTSLAVRWKKAGCAL
jgi:hypothetical protein